MSEENVEIAHDVFGAFNAFMSGERSIDAYMTCFDPEVEVHWRDQQTYPDTPQDLRGIEDLKAFCEQYREGWADTVAETLEIIEAPDDRVLAFVRQSGRGRQSGVPIEIHYFLLSTFRNGKVSS